jgi:EmrB/QacA subfamily drug resistance transporter
MPELTQARRRLILAICCMSLLIVGMDNTIVNVALTTIRRDLHVSLSGLQWTVDSYTLVIASLLMLSGSTADRLGRRRTFQTGLVLFTLGSLLCSLAPGLGWLIAFRMLQAVGGSMLNPVAMSIITNVFTEPRERAWAIGIWGGTVGVSIGLGPVIGGLLTQTIGWRAIFWINVPIGIAALVLAALFIPESKAAHPRRIDIVGQVLVMVLLGCLTYAIIEAPRAGWTSSRTLALFACAAVAGAGLVGYERRRREPLLDMRFFRSVPFAGATVIAVCAFGAFGGYLFLNTLYLQDVRGYSPVIAGLCTLPLATVTGVVAPWSGRLVGARGSRVPLLLAGLGIGAGGLMLLDVSAHTSLLWVMSSYVLFAIGFGMVNPPITNTAVSGMPRSQAGVAAAVASTSRQVGITIGIAVVGSIVNSELRGPLNTGLTTASHPAWAVVFGLGLAVLALGIGVSSRSAIATNSRVAILFDEDDARSARAEAIR